MNIPKVIACFCLILLSACGQAGYYTIEQKMCVAVIADIFPPENQLQILDVEQGDDGKLINVSVHYTIEDKEKGKREDIAICSFEKKTSPRVIRWIMQFDELLPDKYVEFLNHRAEKILSLNPALPMGKDQK